MQKSKIEWTDYVCNPIKGICKMGCPYCYAIRLYKRFKWNPEIRFDYSELDAIDKLKIVKDGGYSYPKVFMGSTHDLFGNWIPDNWIAPIILKAIQNPKIIFIFLTKNPKRYSDFDFPKNCWIGYSTTGTLFHKWDGRHSDNVKFVSLEPMKEPLNIKLNGYAQAIDFDWLIVGKETGNRQGKFKFYRNWLDDIDNFADKVNIPLFLKDNIGGDRQEFPEAIK